MKFKIIIVKISLDFKDKSGDELVTFSYGTVIGLTSNTDLPSPTIPLDKITEETDALKGVLADIASGNTTPENTRLAAQFADTLMLSLTTNAHYVEDTANKKAAGDAVKAETIILSSGYKLKKKPTLSPRDFEVVKTGVSWVHFRVKKTKRGYETIFWLYGIVAAKGEIPTTKIMHVTEKADIIITNLTSGTIVAMAHAPNELGSKVKKYEHPSFSHTAAVTYEWSEFIYVVVP
jgi:hypothetical protein